MVKHVCNCLCLVALVARGHISALVESKRVGMLGQPFGRGCCCAEACSVLVHVTWQWSSGVCGGGGRGPRRLVSTWGVDSSLSQRTPGEDPGLQVVRDSGATVQSCGVMSRLSDAL